MRPGKKLALAGSVLASFAVLAVWMGGRAAVPAPVSPPEAAGRSVGAAAHAAVEVDERSDATAPAAERTVVPPRPQASAVPPGVGDHPFAFAVDVEVVDSLGMPVVGKNIQLAPIGVDMHRSEHQTDHNGRLSLRWRARRPSHLVALALAGQPTCQVVLLHHGAARRVVLGGTSDDSGHDGMPVAHLGPLHPFAWFGENAQLRRSDEPRAAEEIVISGVTILALPQFANLRISRGQTELAIVQLLNARAQGGAEFHLQIGDRVEFADVLLRLQTDAWICVPPTPSPPPPPPALRGIVHGEDGAPAGGQNVAWRLGEDQAWEVTTTGEDGCFELPAGTEGTVTLRAGGSAKGLAERSYALLPDTTTHAELLLWRGRIVRGRAVDGSGLPLPDHVVEWRGVDFAEYGTCATDSDGRFELPNRTGPGRLWLLPRDAEPPLCVSGVVHPDGAEVLLQAEPAGGGLALQAVLPPGCESFALNALVWDTATGLGRRVEPDGEGRIALEQLRAGTYRVVLHADALATIDLGAHWIDGSTCRDLGPVAWPAPRDVTFERGERQDEPTEELHRVGPDFDVRIDGFSADTTKLSLAAGTYLWSWRDGEGDAASRTFTVGIGGAQTVQR